VVSTSDGGSFSYDLNGNMISRRLQTGGTTYSQGWDAENRLISVTAGGTTTQFAYDGDGNLVKKVVGTVTTVYVGAYFEKNLSTGVTTSYYYAGSTRVAMRKGGVVSYLHGDHLGSASLATNSSGGVVANSSTRYYPYGATRSGGSGMPTDYRFTRQRIESALGIYQMGARWYDPYTNRWVSPDTIIPDPTNPQSLNRYSYSLESPLTYTDPDGHCPICALLAAGGVTALAAGAIDLAKQLVVDQKDIKDVNWAEVGGAAAGGFVAGCTLGLAPAGAGVGTLLTLGAIGGAAGSQTQALTQAGLEEALGTNPQGSFIKEARDLGFLDPRTMALNAATGAAVGAFGGKLSGWLRSQLGVPQSAGAIRYSGEQPMIRYQIDLGGAGDWTVKMEGRVINAKAATMERILRAWAMGAYDAAAELLKEGIQQGTVWFTEETTQP
jgi:RHS repeat-associated protein